MSIREEDDTVPVLIIDEKMRKSQLGALTDLFRSTFQREPSFFVKVPGRVNLIGEHIDYCGYAVCPMAIEQHILLAVALSDDSKLHLTNLDARYPDFVCDFHSIASTIGVSENGPEWYKYFLCGVKGAFELIPKKEIPKGMLVAVSGNIPANSGLSSSSALVSAALLSTTHAAQIRHRVSKEELATASASAERYIGTQGGGMDQAIAFLGNAGSAKLIEFNPLRATDVNLPDNAVFVIAHSLAYHNKAATLHFNLRVAECRFAAQIIAKNRNVEWKDVSKLIDIQGKLNKSLEEMIAIVMSELHEEPYSFQEICQLLDTTNEELQRISAVRGNYSASQTFKLRQRALHVFQEAARVASFRRISEDRTLEEVDKIQQLGTLMTKSHNSLLNLYECSHPKVDGLVEKALRFGAFGARLTGAGWGGCIVAITTKERVQDFVENVWKELRKENSEVLTDNEVVNLVFPTEPKQGAVIYVL